MKNGINMLQKVLLKIKILWDFMIQCDKENKPRKPDFLVVNKNERSYAIVDIAIAIAKKRRKKLRDTRN